MQVRAPAKINLSLRILGRRSDGFHEIDTLMVPVSLFDIITITRGGSGEIELVSNDATLPRGNDNLAVKAARLFLQEAQVAAGLTINLQKSIPHGAGLGGGSSDAASVLLGLTRLFQSPLDFNELTALAARIGSDVAFFLCKSPAICRGRGELVTPTQPAEPLRLLLIKPSFGVPTPWAYSRWKDAKEVPGVEYAPQQFSGCTFVNDLERPVFEKYLFLARAKIWLLAQPEVGAAMLSGSGSTLFAALRPSANADAVADRAKAELDPELWTCACDTLAAQ